MGIGSFTCTASKPVPQSHTILLSFKRLIVDLFIFQKEDPKENGKEEPKKAEIATNGNEDDGDDDLDIDDI